MDAYPTDHRYRGPCHHAVQDEEGQGALADQGNPQPRSQIWAATYRWVPFTANHSCHEQLCPVLSPHPPHVQTSIPFSTLLSEFTRRRQGRTSPHIPWPPSFNPVTLLMRYWPFSKDKFPRPINSRVAMRHSQNASFQPLTSYMRFPPRSARVLV